jgi:predicted permease
LPKDFEWLGEPLSGTSSSPEIWMPLASNQLAKSARTLRFLKVTGKLKLGVSIEQAKEEVRRIGAELTNEHPAANKNLSFAAVPLEARTTAKLRPAVFMLLATVGIVLLLASANVANLLIARATSRKREMAVRVALGASRARLLRQLLTESFLLAACGGLLGLALAWGLLKLILAFGPAAMLMRAHIAMDSRAFLFTTGVIVVAALLAGIIPAWRVITESPGGAMREGRGLTRGNRFVRSALAGAQVTIALVLLTGSGLLIRSFLRVLEIHPGFDTRNLLSITTMVPPQSNPQQKMAIYNAIRDQLLATPGVVAVGSVSRLPMLGQNLTSVLAIEGRETVGRPPEVEFRAATPDYFTTMGIPLKAGRIFEDRNSADRLVLIIDELTAQRYFPGTDPVGKRVRFLADNNAPWFTILGVVGTIRHFGLEAEPRPTIYRPVIINPMSNPVLVIRTSGDPAPMTQNLARIVRTAHGNMPAYSIFVMDQLVDRSTAERKFLMWLITAFAAGALLLAGIGVYGAISQSVAQRTQEIGIRVALGASPGYVLRILLQECGQIAGAGIVCGLILGWIGANLGQKLLFRIQPHDALVFTIAASTLAFFSLLACYIPARRALRVDPVIALRTE